MRTKNSKSVFRLLSDHPVAVELLTNGFTRAAASAADSARDIMDDLYEGYNTSEPKGPPQGPPMTGMRPPGTASMRGGGLASRGGMSRAGMAGPGEENRPMTAVRAAGFSSARPGTGAKAFDPMNGGPAGRGPAPPLQKRSENSPEDKCREMEKEVNALIEESARLALDKQSQAALERAKEAGKLERQLCKKREENGLADQINIDLTYSVCFNLANQHHCCGMYLEALNAYSLIVKNKQYAQSGRLRVNMGNIYYEQKKYADPLTSPWSTWHPPLSHRTPL